MNPQGDTSLSGLSVLVVDDERLLRRRLSAHLDALGAAVTEAATLAEACDCAVAQSFDFILLDIHLPDGSGLDLMRENRIPDSTGVVVMTAQGGVEGAVEAMRLGAVDYLVKPFDYGLLPLVMKRARHARQTRRAVEHARENDGQKSFFFGDALAPIREQLDRIVASDRRIGTQLPPVLI
ncbi:MAG: response regulator, partial [Pontiellaceae bacterium]|nr:response regulator [Pontiellaceae bacterium]